MAGCNTDQEYILMLFIDHFQKSASKSLLVPIVGETIILHTESDSKLDGVNLDFSGGKIYYDDDEYTSTDVTIVISKAELYR